MNRSRSSYLKALAVFLALVAAPAFAQGNGNGNGNNRNALSPQPVLLYTVAGNVDAGQNLQVLVIYNNGLAILATQNGSGTGGTGDDCSIQTLQLTQDQIGQLRRELRRAGGLRAGGGPQQGSQNGTPLSTLTVFVDTGNGRHSLANSFSFFDNGTGSGDNGSGLTGAAGRLQTILSGFIGQFGQGGSGGSGGGS